MTHDLERRLSDRARARLTAPPTLLEAAFPDPPADARDRGPALAAGLAAAATLALPTVAPVAGDDFERRAADIALDLATFLTEPPR